MKYFLLLSIAFLLPFSVAQAFDVPARPNTYVADYAHMLSANENTALEQKLEAYEKSTTNEIAVVTIQSLDGDTIENVAQEIFTAWGIGKKDKDNGVLFLISLDDHKTRIQTGYGVEGVLTDLTTSYIQRDVVAPAFRQGAYAGGIDAAIDAIIQSLGGKDIVLEGYSDSGSSPKIPIDAIIFIGIFFFQFIVAGLARSKSWWGGGIVGGILAGVVVWYFHILSFLSLFVFLPFISLGLLLDFLVSRAYERNGGSGHGPWFFGGGGFGRSGGSSFGGFGGGSSGGGGSSSSW